MDQYIKKLREHITANPIRFDDDCDCPALDSLYWHYSECHNMSNDETKAISKELNDYLGDLSFEKNDRVFMLVGSLCAEHERIAFLAGLKLGAQLMMELTEGDVGDE